MDKDKLSIEYVSIDDLQEWDKNPKMHNDEAIKRSVQRFGPRQPIIVQKGTNRIIAGHGRIKAYRDMGLEKVPVIYWECTDEEAEAYAIADNQTTIAGGWDDALLAEVIGELPGDLIDTLGFSESELDELLSSLDIDEPVEIVEDEVPELPEEPNTQPGDIYILGEHRLMCGDSTSKEDMHKLMGKMKARMMFTDPPWNVAIGTQARNIREGIINDNMPDSDFWRFLHKFAEASAKYITGDIYVVMASSKWPIIDDALKSNGYHQSGVIVWVKDTFVMGDTNYHQRFEPIWYGWPKKHKSSFCGRRDLDNVWEIPRPKKSILHLTMKPVELVARAIEYSSEKGDLVIDPFGGSGTTMIAAEQMGRRCAMMELDPRYCDVIVERWENFTGKKAELIRAGAEGDE